MHASIFSFVCGHILSKNFVQIAFLFSFFALCLSSWQLRVQLFTFAWSDEISVMDIKETSLFRLKKIASVAGVFLKIVA